MTTLFHGRVDEDAAVAFAMATNDPNELYLKGLAVPPLFTAALVLEAHRLCGRGALPPGATKGVHGEHDLRILGSVLPNMDLQWQASIFGVRNRGGGVIETTRILVCDREGRPLVEHLWSNFAVGAEVAEETGQEKPDHSFPESARARPVGSRAVPVDRDQAFRYAGVSGDHAPHAMDDERARAEGYPGKILQGFCTFGLCSGAVVDLAAGGDPRRVHRLACRFARPVFPRRELHVDVCDAGVGEGGMRSFAFEARQDGVTVIRHGRADIGPPHGTGR